MEKHTLAELNYTGASTFLRSALSLWSEAGGCLLLLGQGGRAGQGREGRQVPSDKVDTEMPLEQQRERILMPGGSRLYYQLFCECYYDK